MVKQQSGAKSKNLWHVINSMDYNDLRFAAFFVAMMVYAIWGTPTPDNLGLPEFIVGLLLVFATGIDRINAIFTKVETIIWRRAACYS